MSNKGMFGIPLFAILAILCQIRENSLIWSSLIWSHHCTYCLHTTVHSSLYRGCRLAVRLFRVNFLDKYLIFPIYLGKSNFRCKDANLSQLHRNLTIINFSSCTEILEKSHNLGTNNLACTSKSWNRTITAFQFNATKDRREFIGNYAEFDEPESSEAWCNKFFSIVFIVSLFGGFCFQLDFSISSLKPFFILLSKVT